MGTKVEGHQYLERDEESNAIINTNLEAWQLSKMRKERFKRQADEINTLKDEVSEIKSLLHDIVEKLHG